MSILGKCDPAVGTGTWWVQKEKNNNGFMIVFRGNGGPLVMQLSPYAIPPFMDAEI
jgi:hypothetical protein